MIGTLCQQNLSYFQRCCRQYKNIKIIIQEMLNPNPQQNSRYFTKQYCRKHKDRTYEYICNQQKCDYYLSFQCYQCLHENIELHKNQQNNNDDSHRCVKLTNFVKDFHQETVNKLTENIRKQIKDIMSLFIREIQWFCKNLYEWYSPMDQTTTQKQLVYTVVNSEKWDKIWQTSDIKNRLIGSRLRQMHKKFKKDIQQVGKLVNQEMSELKFRPVPLQWKFDRNNVHELLNISGFKDRIIDKKSQKLKYCVGILNQPLSPQKNQVTFTINSQNAYDHLIALGLCSKRQILKMSYETDLRKGIYAIYQAAKTGSSNNAFSLHNTDQSMNYKEAVGWNFKSGDSITLNLTVLSEDKVRVQFKKKKEVFQLFIQKQEAFLHPFVALYSSGDKVSIDVS